MFQRVSRWHLLCLLVGLLLVLGKGKDLLRLLSIVDVGLHEEVPPLFYLRLTLLHLSRVGGALELLHRFFAHFLHAVGGI